MSDAAQVDDNIDDDANDNESVETLDEQRAKHLGWVPADEWKDDPGKHISAEVFLERADNNLPMMQANLRRMTDQLTAMEGRIDAQAASHASRLQHDRKEIADLKRAAAREGDEDTYVALEEKERDLDKAQPAPPPAPDPTQTQAYNEFVGRNPWFQTDRYLNIAAQGISADLVKTNPALDPRQHLAEVERIMTAEFPDKVNGRATSKAPQVESGRRTAKKTNNNKNATDLPKDVRDAAAKFMGDHPEVIKGTDGEKKFMQKWADDYFGSDDNE